MPGQIAIIPLPRFRAGIFPALAILLLVACQPRPAEQLRITEPKRLAVETITLRHTVHFATDSDRLTPTEAEALAAFVRSLGGAPVGPVRVVGHADERLGRVYNLDLAARRAAAVAAALRDSGIDRIDVSVRAFGEQLPREPASTPEAWRENRRVEVIVTRPQLRLPGCPDWSHADAAGGVEGGLSQLGCATAGNLAAMIADPAALLAPGPLAPADGAREGAAVRRYREDKVKKLPSSGTEKQQ